VQADGGLDARANLVGLHVRISGQSILASLLPQNLVNGSIRPPSRA